MFGLVPSTYACALDDDDKKFDMYKIDKKFILSLYPNAKVFQISGRHIDDEVSCVTEERQKDQEPVYIRDGVYALSQFRNSETTIILDDIPAIITFDKTTVECIYDLDSDVDIEKFIDDFISKLPTIDDKEDDEYPNVSLVSFSNDAGYYTVDAEINSVTIDIDKNYNDDFKPIYEDIVDFLGSEERKSGLIILNGEPGTGKSYLIRHIIKNIENNYVLIPPSMAENLASPEFTSFLMGNTDSVFILEDCETVIKDRNIMDVTYAVSSILNMSDGIMSDIFNGKFICTFNADMSTIDDAILRKGRCYAKYTFGKLDKEKAKVLLNEKGIELDEYEDMTLADIYHYEDKNVESVTKKKKIGF
jgi:SpoVK/Ycf46/Vps4 family AAA+-type ATPase